MNESIHILSRSVTQTESIGRVIATHIQPGDVIALDGVLGSGKTQFVRGLAVACGADPRVVSSPTYVLMQEYETDPPIVHVDAYRLTSLSDLESAGWHADEFDEVVLLIEWATRIASELPAGCLNIEIEHIDDEERKLTITGGPRWATCLESLKRNQASQSL